MKDTKEEKMPKAPKAPKVKKAKASKYPEWYIGRPKPMKTKTWEWHKPTKKFYVGLGIVLAILGFITYIVIRLINVSHVTDVFIKPYEHEEEMPETYVLENDKLRFEMDVKTTQFSVLQKDNGHVWYSNPVDVDSDPIALVKEKNNMKSTFLVKYSTENGVDNVYDTYTYSIKRDFFDVKKSANEITVDYTISQMEREFKYPLAIYEEDMDEYLEKMSKADQNVIIKRCYRLVDIDNLKSSDDLVIITIPTTIGNNVLTISGFLSIIIPSTTSKTPSVKNEENNILVSLSKMKYIPFAINITAKI